MHLLVGASGTILEVTRKQKLITWGAIAIAALSLVCVPVGNPATYGKVSNSHYQFYWQIDYGEVTDNGRLWMQFLVIAAAWAAAFFGNKPK